MLNECWNNLEYVCIKFALDIEYNELFTNYEFILQKFLP